MINLMTVKETYYEYKFGTHKLRAEEKIKLLISLMTELIPCRQKQEVKEGE